MSIPLEDRPSDVPPPYSDDPPPYLPSYRPPEAPPYRPPDTPRDEESLLPQYIEPSPTRISFTSGWRGSMAHSAAFLWALAVFSLTYFEGLTPDNPSPSSADPGRIGILYSGACPQVSHVSKILRALTCILSTTTLSTAVHTATVLTSPTRAETDKAHSRKITLELGILSFSNLRHFPQWRAVCSGMVLACGVLAPVMFNAAFFTTTVSLDYYVGIAHSNMISSPPAYADAERMFFPWPSPGYLKDKKTINVTQDQYEVLSGAAAWHQLSVEECRIVYAQDYQAPYRHVVAVTKDPDYANVTGLLAFHVHTQEPMIRETPWLCPRHDPGHGSYDCHPSSLTLKPWLLGPSSIPISYCLAEVLTIPTSNCSLTISRLPLHLLTLLLLTIVLSTLATIILTRTQTATPLLTPSDAIRSFLTDPDIHTEGMCTFSQRDFAHGWPQPAPRSWTHDDAARPRAAAIRPREWILFNSLLALAMFTFFILNDRVLLVTHDRLVGGGGPAVSIVDKMTSLLGLPLPSVLVFGSLPMAGWALGVLAYARLLRIMAWSKEYAGWACKRAPLRPSGGERVRVVPVWLAGVACTLSWAFGGVRVLFFGVDGEIRDDGEFWAVGWDREGIRWVFIAVGVVWGWVLVTAWRRVKKGSPPEAGVCSAAVTAACHDGDGEGVVGLEQGVMWGGQRVVREGRHLGFSRGSVERTVRWGRAARGGGREGTMVVVYS